MSTLQTQTLAESMVRQQGRQKRQGLQQPTSSTASATATAPATTRPLVRQGRGVETTQDVDQEVASSSTRSHHRSTRSSTTATPEPSLSVGLGLLVPTEVGGVPVAPRRPPLQKELSGVTLPWDLASVNNNQEEETKQRPSATDNSRLLLAPESNHSQVSHGSNSSSRFPKEDYMDDDQLEAYIQRLESQPQSTHNLANFLDEQQAVMKTMERKKNGKVQPMVPTPGEIAVVQQQQGGKDELMERLTRKIQQQYPNLLKEDDDNDDDEEEFSFSNDRVGPLPVQQKPRKSGRSLGLAEPEDSDSRSQPSSHSSSSSVLSPGSLSRRSTTGDKNSSLFDVSTPSSGNSFLSSTSTSASSTADLALKCGNCGQPNSDDKWMACDNIASPHLFCHHCVRKYLLQAPVTGAPLELPDATNPLYRLPCLLKKNKPCQGVVHVNAATVLSFQQTMDKFNKNS
jgi:hypothetical protein